jgi:hypothetical protein
MFGIRRYFKGLRAKQRQRRNMEEAAQRVTDLLARITKRGLPEPGPKAKKRLIEYIQRRLDNS